jgi:glycosyltransferase 2 family protein
LKKVENSRDALKFLSSKKEVAIDGFLITTPAQICQATCVFHAFHALGIKLGVVISTQIFFTALLSGILSFVSGGIFGTEGRMLGLLIKYNVNSNYAGSVDVAPLTVAVIFVRLATIWYGTSSGIIAARFVVKNTNHATTTTTS